MDASALVNAVWGGALLILLLIVGLSRRARRGGAHRVGAAGATYDWLNQDKQRAIDLIVEDKAEATRPEYPDGNLPDLESPKKTGPGDSGSI